MSKKPRNPSSKQGQDPGKVSPPKAETRERSSPPRQESTPADQAEPRPSLPAFGFAQDVLSEARKATGQAVQSPAADRPDEVTSESQADRIFRFADSLAASAGEEDEQAPRRLETWVTFDLAEEVFAIPVNLVREALRVSTITRVPHAPHPIRGVTNLRGKVIPVIDLRVRIELPAREIDRLSRILVVGSRGRVLGLLVDAVRQVVHIDLDRVQPPPEDVVTVQSDYLSGVYHQGDFLILLLDVDRILVIKEAGVADIA